jgi:Uracil DNA glycosylase superfamily
MTATELDRLLEAIRACRYCIEAHLAKPLPHEPRPVLRASPTARLAVCSQAPGTRVHASGVPFTDSSGDRLRDWMGVAPEAFYDESRVAIIPMVSAFPGRTQRGVIFPRGWNAQGYGIAISSPCCRNSNSCLPWDPTRRIGTSAERQEAACRRPCSAGADICSQSAVPASSRCHTRPGGTMAG